MNRTRLLPALLLALLMLLPAGCGTRTASAAQPTPAPAETVTMSGTAGTLRVQMPDGWKYEVCPEGTLDDSEACFGVKIWPDSGSDSCVQLYWSDSFGVCGMGLKEETMTLAGDSVSAGYYDGDKNWTFLSYQGKTAASLPGPIRTHRGSRRRVSRCSPCSTRLNGNRRHKEYHERKARPAAELRCGTIFIILPQRIMTQLCANNECLRASPFTGQRLWKSVSRTQRFSKYVLTSCSFFLFWRIPGIRATAENHSHMIKPLTSTP